MLEKLNVILYNEYSKNYGALIMKRKSGFTLAEVLITLAIIGVVSSMTLPTLNTNIGASRNRAALKKALSTLNGAVRMNEGTNGWNFSALTANGELCAGHSPDKSRASTAENSLTMCGLLNDSLVGETLLGDWNDYLPSGVNPNLPLITGNTNASANAYVHYRLADGAVIALSDYASNCTEDNFFTNRCFGYIDVNGAQGPNQVIECNGGGVGFVWDSGAGTVANPNAQPNSAGNERNACVVQRNTNADMFPVVFYDSTVELSSDAAVQYVNAR